MQVMGMKIKFGSEKQTLDLRTGKMVEVPQGERRRSEGRRSQS